MKPRKVLFVGGGTAGSVMPLVALYEELKEQSKGKTAFLFVGSKNGIEKEIAHHNKIPFTPIFSGKIRRYFDIRNLIDPFFVVLGFFQALFVVRKFKPDIILTAGSFISTPVSWAAKLLGVPVFIHQQDVRKTLSNTLTAFAARKITVTLEPSLEYFPEKKVVHIGNPLRQSILGGSRQKAYEHFGLRKDLPIILIVGGGTGALSLNEIVAESIQDLTTFVQVVHLTGKGKKLTTKRQNYFPFEFLRDELKHVYAAADLVVTRGGMSTITELAALKKASIIVPLPGTHQEDNAAYFKQQGAAYVLKQEDLTAEKLVKVVRDFMLDPERKRKLGQHLHDVFPEKATKKYVELIESELEKIYVRKNS